MAQLVERLDLRDPEQAHGIAVKCLPLQCASQQRACEPLARSHRLGQVEVAAAALRALAPPVQLGIERLSEDWLADETSVWILRRITRLLTLNRLLRRLTSRSSWLLFW